MWGQMRRVILRGGSAVPQCGNAWPMSQAPSYSWLALHLSELKNRMTGPRPTRPGGAKASVLRLQCCPNASGAAAHKWACPALAAVQWSRCHHTTWLTPPCRPAVMVSWAALRPVFPAATCRCQSRAATCLSPLPLAGTAPAPLSRMARFGARAKRRLARRTSPALCPHWWIAHTNLWR